MLVVRYWDVFVVLSLACFALCVWIAFAASGWPSDVWDGARDAGMIEQMRSGNWTQDPTHNFSPRWYNPLYHAIHAILSDVFGVSTLTMLSSAPTLLNISAPITFYILARVHLERTWAFAALASFLSLSPGLLPGPLSAGYSIDGLPITTLQFVTYTTLALTAFFYKKPAITTSILLGVSLGAAALAHNSILAVTWSTAAIVIFTLIGRGKINITEFFGFAAVISGIAVGIAAIHFLPIALDYQGIANPTPSTWVPSIAVFSFSRFWTLIDDWMGISTLIALVGLFGIIRQGRTAVFDSNNFVVLVFLFVLSVLALFGVTVTVFHLNAIQVAPYFHFLFYLKAVEALLFGYGFRVIFGLLKTRAPQYALKICGLLVLPLFAHGLFLAYDRYKSNISGSLWMSNQPELVEATQWLLDTTNNDDIVLTSEFDNGLDSPVLPVMASGRQMISNRPYFLSPLLPFRELEARRASLYEMLLSEDCDSLGRAGVSYVFMRAKETPSIPECAFLIEQNKSFAFFRLSKLED